VATANEDMEGMEGIVAARGMVDTEEVDMVVTMDIVAMETMAVETTTVVEAEAPMDMVTMDTDMVVETMATMATMVVVATMVARAEVAMDMVIMDTTTGAMVIMATVAMLDTTTRDTASVLLLRLLNLTPVLLISSCMWTFALVSELVLATDISCELKNSDVAKRHLYALNDCICATQLCCKDVYVHTCTNNTS